jgi:hypothetical protein
MTAEQRPCPVCGTDFTWTPAAPRQKYCSKRCKHRWHTTHRKPRDRRRPPACPPARTAGSPSHWSPGSSRPPPASPHRRRTSPRHAAMVRDKHQSTTYRKHQPSGGFQ